MAWGGPGATTKVSGHLPGAHQLLASYTETLLRFRGAKRESEFGEFSLRPFTLTKGPGSRVRSRGIVLGR